MPLLPLGGWEGPVLAWTGPSELEAPECPDSAPHRGYEGHADLVAPNECAACSCDAPTGWCGLPATITVSSATCPAATPGGHTPFNPPAGWTGSCTAAGALPSGNKSITIAPLTLHESGCAVVQPQEIRSATPEWGTFVRVCQGVTPENHSGCSNPAETCMASAKPPPEFRACVYQKGDGLDCPSTYPEKRVFYDDFADHRTCSTCACGAPAGGLCKGEISFYESATCTPDPFTQMMALDSSGSNCYPLPASMVLASKSAIPPIYVAGSCEASGGEPSGSADPIGPSTLCCIRPSF